LGKDRDELVDLLCIDNSKMDASDVDDILNWRKYSMETALRLQNADKKSLPTVTVPKIHIKGCTQEVSIRSKRQSSGKFGSNTLLIVPGEQGPQQVKPSSYLEVFKKSQTKIL